MSSALVATALALFSIGCAFVVCQFMLFRRGITGYFVLWALLAPCAFLINNAAVFFIVTAAILAGATFAHRRNRTELFTGIFPALPSGLGFVVPFPGINYLMTMTYDRLATLIVLTPTLLTPRRGRQSQKAGSSVTRLVFLFFTLVAILDFRGLPVTSGFRHAFYSFLVIALPYLAFSRTTVTRQAILDILKIFVLAAVILCFIGLVSEAKRWNFYGFNPAALRTGSGPGGFAGYRGGFLRVGATLPPAFLAYILATAIVILEYIRVPFRITNRNARLVQLLLLMGAIVSTGRGGWLGGLVTGLAYGILSTRNRVLSVIAWAGFLFVAGFVTFALANHGNLYFLDPYGTVKYRVDLIFNSFHAIGRHPLLGSTTFLSDEALQASRQGQGIIDIVNTYLSVALSHGLIGLALFVGIFAVALRQLLRTGRKLKRLRKRDEENMCFLMISILLGYMAFIATISPVSLIENYGFIFLGLAVGIMRFAHAEIKEARQTTITTERHRLAAIA